MQLSYKFSLITVFVAVVFIGCATKGDPTPHGTLISLEQIKSLKSDQSWNGKKVSIEGYASFCKKGFAAPSRITMGKKNLVIIYSAQDCDGEALMQANLLFAGNRTKLSGEKERNFIAVDDNFDNKTMKFTTDDYQELANSKFKFSGKLIWDDGNYYLEDVSIHQ